MIKILTSSGDTYITNKIVDASFSVSGNVGRAGTLDLFKLYDESIPSGSNEISRILIDFDLSNVITLSSSIDAGDPTFRANLRLKSLGLGQSSPSKFTVSVFPLSSSFDEGMGRDIVSFADVGAANWLSSSNGTRWISGGCGYTADMLTASDYVRSDVQGGVSSFECTQYFKIGNEDLDIDVTKILSSSFARRLSFHGLRLSFSGSDETDDATRFVKRFGSTNARDFSVRPRLVIQCDDSRVDNRSSSFIDTDNSLFYFSSDRGTASPFKEINGKLVTGSNCVILTLSTSSFSASFTGSQVTTRSGMKVPASYSVSFFLSGTSVISGSETFNSFLQNSGSVVLTEVLKTATGNRTLRSGTVTVKNSQWNVTSIGDPDFIVSSHASAATFSPGQEVRVVTRFFDRKEESRASKFPLQVSQTEVYGARYRIRDSSSGELLFDYCDGSKMSADSSGWFLSLPTEGMKPGGSYSLEYEVTKNGRTFSINDRSTILRVI